MTRTHLRLDKKEWGKGVDEAPGATDFGDFGVSFVATVAANAILREAG